jgi:hypothetical protein
MFLAKITIVVSFVLCRGLIIRGAIRGRGGVVSSAGARLLASMVCAGRPGKTFASVGQKAGGSGMVVAVPRR